MKNKPKNSAAAALGAMGGTARAKKMTAKERSDHGKHMVTAREAKRRAI